MLLLLEFPVGDLPPKNDDPPCSYHELEDEVASLIHVESSWIELGDIEWKESEQDLVFFPLSR